MPQIKIGETVQFTVGAFNSISRNPSSQAPGTWYYTVKGGFANGDKLQGTAHMLWAMLPVWPGAGGQMTITRTGPMDFTADKTAPGDGVPPKLEEYSAAGRSFSTILPAVVSAEEVPNEIDGTGPAVATGATLPAAAPSVAFHAATAAPAAPAANNAANTAPRPGGYDLQTLGDLAEQCMIRASGIMERFAEAGWEVNTGTAISLGQSMFNAAQRLGVMPEEAGAKPPDQTEGATEQSDAFDEAVAAAQSVFQ